MSASRVRVLLVVVALSLFALGAVPARAQFMPPALDHFTVYDATGQLNPPIVTMQDQFQILTRDLGQTRFLFVPARKNAEPLLDPFSHLTCYLFPSGTPPPPLPPGATITVKHQFVNSTTLTLGPALFACIPTEKYPPQQVTIDHFVCYQATGPALTVGATFIDQFNPGQTHQLAFPAFFCSAATKGIGTPPLPDLPPPVDDPSSHLACYTLAPPGPAPTVALVPIRNQFGNDELTLGQRRFACLPATKVPPTGTLDHFVYYHAIGPDGPPVAVEDQFGPQPAGLDLGPVRSFLVPADKNAEGIVDLDSHLTGYFLPGVPPPATIPQVIAHNQFGSQVIKLGPAEELLVPTRKLVGGAQGLPSIDHFACYHATGHSLDRTVTLVDQFHTATVTRVVKEPFLFCNPADKNNEGVLNVEDHLTCFRTDPPGLPVGTVPIHNQFSPAGGPHLIQVLEDFGLCVPSKKEIPTTQIPSLSAPGFAALAAALCAVSLWLLRRRLPGELIG